MVTALDILASECFAKEGLSKLEFEDLRNLLLVVKGQSPIVEALKPFKFLKDLVRSRQKRLLLWNTLCKETKDEMAKVRGIMYRYAKYFPSLEGTRGSLLLSQGD